MTNEEIKKLTITLCRWADREGMTMSEMGDRIVHAVLVGGDPEFEKRIVCSIVGRHGREAAIANGARVRARSAMLEACREAGANPPGVWRALVEECLHARLTMEETYECAGIKSGHKTYTYALPPRQRASKLDNPHLEKEVAKKLIDAYLAKR